MIQAGLDGRGVGEVVAYFFHKGLLESTKRSYAVPWNRFRGFCHSKRWHPVPVSESVACAFMSSLAVGVLACSSIKVYLAGVRQSQVEMSFPDPNWGSMPRLAQMLRGICRHQAERGDHKRERHPISPEVMMRLQSSWQKSPGFYATMLWEAVCMCNFGCLRAGEITAPERGSFDPGHTSPSAT